MTFTGWLTIVLFAVILTVLALPFGAYMAKVYRGERVLLTPIFAGPERFLYWILRVNPEREQDWKAYARSLLIFSVVPRLGETPAPAVEGARVGERPIARRAA